MELVKKSWLIDILQPEDLLIIGGAAAAGELPGAWQSAVKCVGASWQPDPGGGDPNLPPFGGGNISPPGGDPSQWGGVWPDCSNTVDYGQADMCDALMNGGSGTDQFLVNGDRKSTRLNSSHLGISYAVFCFKKKK